MFETAELKRRVTKQEYQEREPQLRQALLTAQQELRAASFPVIVLLTGVDGGGKGETVNLLNEWMDPRWLDTRAFGEPSSEERERPEYWRFWRDLPPKGRIGLVLSAWYSRPLLRRVSGGPQAQLDASLDEILTFEQLLADDGALIIKFWLHLGKDAQQKRFKSLEKNPLTRWRVTKRDWDNWKRFDRFSAAAERIISRTSTGHAPWHIIEGWDHRYRSLRIGELLLRAVRRRLDAEKDASASESRRAASPKKKAKKVVSVTPEGVTVLDSLDMSRQLSPEAYKRQLARLRGKLASLHRKAMEEEITTLLVFEGWDAAGKGGAIRRITGSVDVRAVRIIPIAKPTDEEDAHHYLWRFWRHLPRAGKILIFDRSWYGRVLVERVEGFASDAEWWRAYNEIRLFEQQLIDHGIVLVKFWIHITKDEQEKRFRDREQTPWKRWKLTPEDWRNRERWDDYEIAVHDMVERTSTGSAPWVLVEGDDKRYARVRVLREVCERLEGALKAHRK